MAVLIIIPVLVFFALKFIPNVQDKLLSEKQRNVRNSVEVAYGVIEKYDKLYQNGEMSLSEAQKAAEKIIQDMRYETSEYFWINDFDVKMVMHPIKSELNNTSVANIKDPNGKYLFREMVEIAKNEGEGYIEYMWPKPNFTEPVPKISFVKAFENWGWIIGSGIYIDDIEADLAAFRNEVFLFIFLITLFALVVGYFTARSISKPVKKLETAAAQVAEGNNDVFVENTATDEIGLLTASFNKMVKNIKSAMEEVRLKSKDAEEAAEIAKAAQRKAQAQEEYLSRNTKVLLEEMEKFSNGDLTVKVKAENDNDDVGKLFIGFNNAVNKIKEIILSVTSAVEATASTSTQITKSSEEVAAGTQEQSAQSEEVSSAVEEMSKTITEMAQNATSASNSSNHSKQQTASGAIAIEKSKAGFERIIQSAQKTGEIIGSLTQKNKSNQPNYRCDK